MTRVVCPLCRTGFEAKITRDDYAVNCVACGVAFSAQSFLTRDNYSTKTGLRPATGVHSPAPDSAAASPLPLREGAGGGPPATTTSVERASPSTHTGRLFANTTGSLPKARPATPQATQESMTDLRERLRRIRAKLLKNHDASDAAADAPAAPVAEPAKVSELAPPPVAEVQAKEATPPAVEQKKDEPASPLPSREGQGGGPPRRETRPAPPKARRPLLEGSFGPYDIQAEVARGGVGAVFRAIERDGGREVALKVLLEGSSAAETDGDRFRHECETAKALSLPGMVQIYAVGEIDGHPYMAMELVKGRSLDKVIPEKTLSVNDALVLMKSVAETVGAMHDAGYVHRDLKPGNILIDEFGSPKVADFGLIKSLDEITRLTASGLVCGTPAYMSPEQARGDGKAIDPRSDVWALGAVLYEMLTSQPPFQAENALRLMAKITREPSRPPRLLNIKVPQDVHFVVMKCLEKNADDRYANAREMAADIARFLNGEPLKAATQPQVRKFLRSAAQNRRALVAIGGALAAVVLVAVLARMVFAPREDGPLIERGYKTLGDRSLKGADRLSAAEKLFRQALTLDPRSGKACLGLGLCLASGGIDYQRRTVLDPRKASEALAMTNQAAELNPQLRAEAHAQLACFNMWLGQYVEESREREQAVELASNNLRYREALGIAYWNAGVQANTPDYFKRAVREFQAIVRDDPEYPKVREYIKLLQERFLTQPPGQVHVSLGDRVR